MKYHSLLLSLIFLSSFFAIGLPSDDVYYAAMFFSFFLLFINNPTVKTLCIFVLLLVFFIFNTFLNFDKGFKILTILQFFLSIILCAYLYNYILDKKAFFLDSRFLFLLISFLLVLIFLEMVGLSTPFVNAFRMHFLGVSTNVIENEYSRDLRLNGFTVRPTLFMKEASYAYCFIFFITSCYLVLNKNIKSLLILYIINVFLFFIYRTPSVLLAISFYTFLFFVDYSVFLKKISKRSKLIIAIIFLSLILALIAFLKDHLLERFGSIDFSDRDALNSITIRAVAPVYFIYDVYKEYPFFGIGISNLDFAYNRYGVIGNNGFANFLCFLGLIGTIFIFCIFVFWCKLKKINKKDVITCCCFLFFILNQLGGTTTFIVWLYFFSFLACLTYSSRKSSNEI